MKTIFIFSLLSSLLLANNPIAFRTISNPIYNNTDKILKLRDLEQYERYTDKVNNYYFDVDAIKDTGFEIDKKNKSVNIKEYLNNLRVLIKVNNFFVKLINLDFRNSMIDEDSKTFIDCVNSGLIDVKKTKKMIMKYYHSHQNEIDPTGIIQTYLDEEERIRKAREARLRARPTREEILAARIKRIRAIAKRKKDAQTKKIKEEFLKNDAELRAKYLK